MLRDNNVVDAEQFRQYLPFGDIVDQGKEKFYGMWARRFFKESVRARVVHENDVRSAFDL